MSYTTDDGVSYDEKCYALALHFLLDEMSASDPRFDRLAERLAIEFQRQADDFIRFEITHAGTVAAAVEQVIEHTLMTRRPL